MRRGDVVTAAVSGAYGKPRSAVVVTQDSLLDNGHDAIVLCQMTSAVGGPAYFRVTVEPSAENGLRLRSDIMADKPMAVAGRRIGAVIGRLNETDIARLNIALAFALGLSD